MIKNAVSLETKPDLQKSMIVLVALTLLFFARGASAESPLSVTVATAIPQTAVGSISKGRYVLQNRGTDPIMLLQSDASSLVAPYRFVPANSKLLPSPCNGTLAVGASCAMSIEFSPQATGVYVANPSVSFSYLGQMLSQSWAISATAVNPARLVISPSSPFSFGRVPVNDIRTRNQSFTVTNVGGMTATKIAFVSSGLSEPFQLSLPIDCGLSLGAGMSCNFNVQFYPQSVGTFSGGLTLRYSDSVRVVEMSILVNGEGFENNAPIANNAIHTVREGNTLLGTLGAVDPEGDPLTYVIRSNGSQGRVVLLDPATGAFSYKPDFGVYGQYGPDSFTFSVTAGVHESNVATISIQFMPVEIAWARQFGGSDRDSANASTSDSLGNLINVGSTDGSFEGESHMGLYDAFVAKLDPAGNILWKKQLGGTHNDYANAVSVDFQNNIFIAGGTWGSFEGLPNKGSGDAFIAKLDPDGNIIWKKQLGGIGYDGAYGASVDASGNMFVTGYTSGSFEGLSSKGRDDAFIAKFAPDGNIIWKKQLGGIGYDQAFATCVDSMGNVIMAGYTTYKFEGLLNKGYDDSFISKLDTDGNIIWKLQLGGMGYDYATSIAVNVFGDVFFTGRTDGSFEGRLHKGRMDVFVSKISTDGFVRWSSQLGGSNLDEASAINADSSGNVFVTGRTWGDFEGLPSIEGQAAFLIKLSTSGALLFRKRFKPRSGDVSAMATIVDVSGNVFISGSNSGSFAGEVNQGLWDAFIAKIEQ